MNSWFKQAQHEWHRLADSIKLYHGTSSAFVDDISMDGIDLPGDDLEEYCRSIASKYFPNGIPDKVWKDIEKYTLVHRTMRNADGGEPHSIYLTTSLPQAHGYAESYAQTGGEIGHEIYQWSSLYLLSLESGEEHDLRDWRERSPIQPMHLGSYPVVVEVVVPFEWAHNSENMRTSQGNMLKLWEEKEHLHDQYEDFNAWMDAENVAFEVRCSRRIPAHLVKEIHGVAV